jgi:hypothetical protein
VDLLQKFKNILWTAMCLIVHKLKLPPVIHLKSNIYEPNKELTRKDYNISSFWPGFGLATFLKFYCLDNRTLKTPMPLRICFQNGDVTVILVCLIIWQYGLSWSFLKLIVVKGITFQLGNYKRMYGNLKNYASTFCWVLNIMFYKITFLCGETKA